VRTRELPPPLPPGERTVGQLVAETIRAYGDNFLRALPLGLPLALVAVATAGESFSMEVAALCLGAPFFSVAYAYAVWLVSAARPTPLAFLLGVLVWFPAPVLLTAFVLPSLAWLALFGLAVPVTMIEGLGFRASLARARRLALADFVHGLGSLCALVLVFVLTTATLAVLLHDQADNTVRVALFLAVLFLSPMLYLGGALLYHDQAARVGSGRPRRRSRPDADLHPPVDADAARGADPQIEP
jgi:hypothetical protein